MAKASEKNKYEDASVTRSEETAQIVLPRDMSLAEARNWLTRQEEMENTKIAVTNVFEGVYPIEGAYALLRYLQQKYGFVDAVATPTLFGEDPPTFVGVEVEPGKIVQVPWGRLQLNGIDGYLEAGVHLNKREKTCCFTLNGEVRRKSEEKVKELVADLKVYIRDNSIFRGKAFQIEFPDKDDRFQIDPSYLPRLLNVSNVNEEELTFDDEIREMVEDTVFSLVEHTETARRLQIPRKRGILLEGPFGTGKTLTAFVLAKKATANGWTYIYVKRAADIDRAVGMARQYQPCVVFCEDVDTAATVNRTEDVNSILNTMDGIDSKDGEVMVVVTTNVVSSITKAMLRPGRIDTVIPIRPPGARAAQKLLRIYGRGLIDEEVTLDKVGEELNGRIPAFIRETVERAKLSAIRHVMAGERLVLTERDLLTAARSMKYQIELLEETPRKVYDDPQVEAADVLGQHVATAIRGAAASVISAARPEKAMNGASSHHTPSITDGL